MKKKWIILNGSGGPSDEAMRIIREILDQIKTMNLVLGLEGSSPNLSMNVSSNIDIQFRQDSKYVDRKIQSVGFPFKGKGYRPSETKTVGIRGLSKRL
jgi:hypothetical protein